MRPRCKETPEIDLHGSRSHGTRGERRSRSTVLAEPHCSRCTLLVEHVAREATLLAEQHRSRSNIARGAKSIAEQDARGAPCSRSPILGAIAGTGPHRSRSTSLAEHVARGASTRGDVAHGARSKLLGYWVAIPVQSSKLLGCNPRAQQQGSGLLSPTKAACFGVAIPVQGNRLLGC